MTIKDLVSQAKTQCPSKKHCYVCHAPAVMLVDSFLLCQSCFRLAQRSRHVAVAAKLLEENQ
jgi:hypothetical protein